MVTVEERLAVLETQVEDLRDSFRNLSHAAWGAIAGVALLLLQFISERVSLTPAAKDSAEILWHLATRLFL